MKWTDKGEHESHGNECKRHAHYKRVEKSGVEFINLCTIDFLSQVIIAVGAF